MYFVLNIISKNFYVNNFHAISFVVHRMQDLISTTKKLTI